MMGNPASGTSPAEPFARFVKVIPKTFAAILASSSKVSKKSPILKSKTVSGCSALILLYCDIKGVCILKTFKPDAYEIKR